MPSGIQPLSVSARGRIVRAWASAIGASPHEARKEEWIFVERVDLDAVVVVRIEGYGFVAAPPKALGLLRLVSPELLLDADALAKVLPAGAVPVGSADLLFAENGLHPGRDGVCATLPTDVAAVRGGVSTAEWEESGIQEADKTWTAMDPAGRPAAIAGFTRWRLELAQMAVLASPQYRGAGLACAAVAVAMQEALDDGLIAQWRSRQGNETSRRLAQRLGFIPLGVQAAVALGSR